MDETVTPAERAVEAAYRDGHEDLSRTWCPYCGTETGEDDYCSARCLVEYWRGERGARPFSPGHVRHKS